MTEWPAGAATGVGSMPGDDIVEAIATVFGELPDLPHLPELPARGAGADLVGRGAGILVDLPVELAVSGWRMASKAGHAARRTADLLERDLDALTDYADGYAGLLKIQVAGPWTLAGEIELRNGERLLTDHGATADLVASLAEGLSDHLAELRRRVPGATFVTQLDEPLVPAVLAGSLRTASGYRTVAAVESAIVERDLRTVLEAAGELTVVHCCAADAPLALFRSAGASAVSLDLSLVSQADYDDLAEHIDAGGVLVAGVVPGGGGDVPSVEEVADPLRTLVTGLGFAPERVPAAVTLSPSCGLAGATSAYARAALRRCTEAAHKLASG
ncbi:methionine synthase [Fodinicola acaciae]|uniref:methionine synthase n=1 Tax=Fodinicola acaciae TaxID=2681555 RepID=UPI0013D1A9B3|nr:methionine synthase [Fodinicola acaciae]